MAETIRTLQLSVSQANAHQRASELQDEKLDEYQQKVEKMQRLMEETKMVSECKIRQLQTENEALRMHLKLALESLKNPIPPVTLEKRQPSLASLAEENSQPDRDQENREGSPPFPSDSETEMEVWEDEDEDDDETITDDNEREAYQMQSRMEDLLGDLSVFKRKLASDHERWHPNEQTSPRRRRRALGAIAGNIR